MEDCTGALLNILHGALLKGPKHGDAARKNCTEYCSACCMEFAAQGCCMAHCRIVLQSTLHCTLCAAQRNAPGISQLLQRTFHEVLQQTKHRVCTERGDVPWGCGTEHCTGNLTGE